MRGRKYLFRINDIRAKLVQLLNSAFCHLSFEFPARDGSNGEATKFFGGAIIGIKFLWFRDQAISSGYFFWKIGESR